MTTQTLPAARAARDFGHTIDTLARDYRRAAGPLMALMQRIGGEVESQWSRLPAPVAAQIERAVAAALSAAMDVAAQVPAPSLSGRSTNLAAMAAGAAGGAGGLPTALVEIPVTITVFLHAIRAEARRAGFDPDTPGIRAACLEVFAAGAPISEDDGINTAFLSARLTLTGAAMHKIIATVAPRLAMAMGQKLAAQTVPLLGAGAGAAINLTYLRYYREMARIRFALMQLAQAHGGEVVTTSFARACAHPRLHAR